MGSTVMLYTVVGARGAVGYGAGWGGSDHCSGGGEDPVIEGDFFGQLLGLLGHGCQFIEENLGVEFARDPGPPNERSFLGLLRRRICIGCECFGCPPSRELRGMFW